MYYLIEKKQENISIEAIDIYGVFTWRHGGHNGVPNQSRGSWTLFLCKRFLLLQEICIDAGHVGENTLLLFHKKSCLNFRNNITLHILKCYWNEK